MPDVTRLLNAVGSAEPGATAQLLQLAYDDLRHLAARRLAHEAYLRLVGGAPDRHWDGRAHFFAAAHRHLACRLPPCQDAGGFGEAGRQQPRAGILIIQWMMHVSP
jgi:hypothetical protein